ncbi:MAG: MATE family efflux transporter, partial [Kangiellaceae bacterium]|nr:MATE family efflux transporter [Kangiellaceae bacterium]
MSTSLSTILFHKPTHKAALALAVPMILSNLTVPLTGIVDTAVIGHLDKSAYLAATAIGSLIISLIMWSMGFLRMGTTGVTAQAYGANEQLSMFRSLINSVVLA